MITGESIKSAISSKLAAEYPTVYDIDDPEVVLFRGIPIYKEKIAQGAERPYFAIAQLDLDQQKLMKEKYNRLYQMKVSYYSNIGDLQQFKNLDEMGNELLELLRTIEVESGQPIITEVEGFEDVVTPQMYPVRGIQMSSKIVDDVLQFFVSYLVRVEIPQEHTKMTNLSTNVYKTEHIQ